MKRILKFTPEKFFIVTFLLCIITGIYSLFTILYLNSPGWFNEKAEFDASVKGENNTQNQIIIPKINLEENILEGDESTLDKGIWHKYTDRNPENGGNFLLTGHRFRFGLTPGEIKRKSPLFNINKLEVGDEIIIRWNGKTLWYRVNEIRDVPNTAVEIENQTTDPILTLYTCTLEGSSGPRTVVLAHPVAN